MSKSECLNCGKELTTGNGFIIIGQQFIIGLPKNPSICDFQCLIEWDTTGPNAKGNQGFNLDEVELKPL